MKWAKLGGRRVGGAARWTSAPAGGEAPEVRSGDAGVENVPDDRDLFAFQEREARLFGIEQGAEREQIEQRLGRVFVLTVASIEDSDSHSEPIHFVGDRLGHSGFLMADHHHVGSHGQIGLSGIEDGLAFGQR